MAFEQKTGINFNTGIQDLLLSGVFSGDGKTTELGINAVSDLGIDGDGKLSQGFAMTKDIITPTEGFYRWFTGNGYFGVGDKWDDGVSGVGKSAFRYSKAKGVGLVKSATENTITPQTLFRADYFLNVTDSSGLNGLYNSSYIYKSVIKLDKGIEKNSGGLIGLNSILNISTSNAGIGMAKLNEIVGAASQFSFQGELSITTASTLILRLDKSLQSTINAFYFIRIDSTQYANLQNIQFFYALANSISNALIWTAGKILIGGGGTDINASMLQLSGSMYLTQEINFNNQAIIQAGNVAPTALDPGQANELRMAAGQLYFYNGIWNKVNLTAL